MTTYLHPGVYIEEIPSGSRPIEGVSTSVAAFVGEARRGPAGEANLIGKLDDYVREYGEVLSEDDDMGLAVQAFYLNGGGAAYICRLVGAGSGGSSPTGARSRSRRRPCARATWSRQHRTERTRARRWCGYRQCGIGHLRQQRG